VVCTWAANLLHGGAEIRDREASRWSQVTHYYFENCAYYWPMASHLLPGSVAFIEPVNVLTGEPVVLKYCDTPLSPEYVQQCRARSQAYQEAQENDLPEGLTLSGILN